MSRQIIPLSFKIASPNCMRWTSGSSIICLFFVCGPFAIFFAIISVIIHSFNCQSWWFSTHIRQKIDKTIVTKPMVANFNTPLPIIFVSIVLWIVTTPFHICPTSICRATFHAMFYWPWTPPWTLFRFFAIMGFGHRGLRRDYVSSDGAGVRSLLRCAL